MTMPYRIELVNGPGTRQTPFKTYPNGRQAVASPEEVQAWGHLQEVEAKLKEAAATVEVREGTIRMACDRLGGLVEGRPPLPINFLQRIDELVALEQRTAPAAGGGKGKGK